MFFFHTVIPILFTTYVYVIARFYLIIFLGGWGMDENWARVKAAWTRLIYKYVMLELH